MFALMGVPRGRLGAAEALVRIPRRAELGPSPDPRPRSRSPPTWPPTAGSCGDFVARAAAGARRRPLQRPLAIHDEAPEQLTAAEITSILFSLSFAGHETTTGLIGNAVRRLLEERERWEELVADPTLCGAAVDETLRYDTSVPVWRRVTSRDTELGGVALAAGTRLLLWLAAGNRDPRVFAAPDRFDLHRDDSHRALSFGKGAHACLGAALGRLEGRLVLEELLRRRPGLRLVPGQELRFHPNISFRGPLELWVEEPAPA